MLAPSPSSNQTAAMIGLSNQEEKKFISKDSVVNGGRPDYLNRYQLLTYRQVERLSTVMETYVPIHGTGNFPTLEICPSLLVQAVKKRVEEIGVKVTSIRLNGSAATHVLSENAAPTYKDLDLIFQIDNMQQPPKQQQRRTSPQKQPVAAAAFKPKLGQDFESVEDCVVDGITQRPPFLTKQRSQSEDTVSVIEDSGYASSESISSYPPSPSEPTLPELNCIKDVHAPPTTKPLSEEDLQSLTARCSETLTPYHNLSPYISYPSYRHGRDNCWEQIKDAVMDTLLDYLPPKVSRERICSSMLANAYVQKKVKVTNERDQWSLISLNNNTGRNLELKFVQSMHRQYEFSVDSFQIELGSFLEFRRASQSSVPGGNPTVEMNKRFYPTVLAESVYGDFDAALRHLRFRRICTYRPEEIRGGGLLRYCNLRVRKYRPGDCDERGRDIKFIPGSSNPGLCTSDPDNVSRLEQHMCSRFFIDFGSIQYQSKKLVSYLENRFAGEDDLKLEYLIMLRNVVSSRTVCLMQHELKLILDHITHLVRQTLANNIARSNPATSGYCEFYPTFSPSMPYHQVIDHNQTDYYHPHHPGGMTTSSHCYLATTLYPPTPSDRSSPMSVQSICDQSARSSPDPYSRPPSAPPSTMEGYYTSMAPPPQTTLSMVATSQHQQQHYHYQATCNMTPITTTHVTQQQQPSSPCVCCYCGCFCCAAAAAACPYSAYMPLQQQQHQQQQLQPTNTTTVYRNDQPAPPPSSPPSSSSHHAVSAAVVVSSNGASRNASSSPPQVTTIRAAAASFYSTSTTTSTASSENHNQSVAAAAAEVVAVEN